MKINKLLIGRPVSSANERVLTFTLDISEDGMKWRRIYNEGQPVSYKSTM